MKIKSFTFTAGDIIDLVQLLIEAANLFSSEEKDTNRNPLLSGYEKIKKGSLTGDYKLRDEGIEEVKFFKKLGY